MREWKTINNLFDETFPENLSGKVLRVSCENKSYYLLFKKKHQEFDKLILEYFKDVNFKKNNQLLGKEDEIMNLRFVCKIICVIFSTKR